MGKERCDFSPRLEVERFGRLLKDERFIRGVSLWWQGTVSNINWAYQEFVKKSSKLEASFEVSPQNRLVSPDFGGIEEFTNPEEEEGLTLELLLLREKWLVDRPIGQMAWISPGLDQNDHSFLYLWTRESRNQNKVTLQALRLDIRGDQLNQFLDRLSSSRKTNLGKNLPDGRQRILATSIYSETEETFLTPEKVDSLLLALTTNQKVEIFEERMTLPRPEFIFWPERTVRLEAPISNSIQPQGLALGLRPFLSESGRQSPILIFRNNETKIEAQNALVFEEGEKKQEVQQKPPTQEVPIGAKFSQLEPLSMFQIIEKSAKKPERELVVELPSHTAEVEALVSLPSLNPNVEKPAQNSTTVENRIVRPVVEVEQPQVKKEVVKERIAIPLIEIPMGTSMIYSRREKRAERVYIIEAEVEPVKMDQGIEEKLDAYPPTAVQVFPTAPQTTLNEETESLNFTEPARVKLLDKTSILKMIESNSAIENLKPQKSQGLTLGVESEGEKVRGGQRIFLVKNFKIDYSHISMYENRGQGENPMVVRKLVWVGKNDKNNTQPAIFEREPGEDQNQQLHRLLHFLRKVVKQVFGDDILWPRKITAARWDEEEAVETIEEIEYYLQLLNQGTYAQVFAFVS